MNVLTKYFPSASIFCHQINHPLGLHDLYKGRKVTVTQVTEGPGKLHSGERTGTIATKGNWDSAVPETQETFTASEA